jgi:Uma2 family endonuclease
MTAMARAATRLDRTLVARDLDTLPHEWDTRYELIEGVLFMSRRPSHEHQQILLRLAMWVGPAVLAAGGDAVPEPGIVWEDEGEDNVSLDFAILLGAPPPPRGTRLRRCPEIVVEVLSPDPESLRRDREFKRRLYWRRGAREYWIVDPERRELRRLTRGAADWIESRLGEADLLRTPLLPDWSGVRVGDLFP